MQNFSVAAVVVLQSLYFLPGNIFRTVLNEVFWGMKSSPKAPSIIRYLLITFIVLLVLLGYYWFNYIPFRENYFTNRNLRLLSDMSENITQVVESYQGQLDKNFINRDNSIFQMIVEQGHVRPRELFRSLRRGPLPAQGDHRRLHAEPTQTHSLPLL